MKKIRSKNDAASFDFFSTELETLANYLDPTTIQYYQELKKRRIVINEEIDENFFNFAILPLRNMLEDGSNEPIEILLNTVGGSIVDALSICDLLDQAKSEVTITVTTYAYSMGAIILMAGFNNPNVKKRCYPSSLAMIHDGQIGFGGKTSAVRDAYNFHERLEEKIKHYIISHSKIDQKLYAKIKDKEFYMFTEDMLQYGLVDEIIGQKESISATRKRTRGRLPKKRTTK